MECPFESFAWFAVLWAFEQVVEDCLISSLAVGAFGRFRFLDTVEVFVEGDVSCAQLE